MTKTTATTRFGLIRHALTDWNMLKRIQGQTETHLAPEGIRQALAWRKHIPEKTFSRILTSDLMRARETARLINETLGLSIHQDSRLKEQDWGKWVGLTVRELRKRFPEVLAEQEAAGWDFRPPGGESRRTVIERSRAAILEAGLCWPGEIVLVVCHEGILKCLLYDLCQRGLPGPMAPVLMPRHLHWISLSNGELVLDRMNALPLDPDNVEC